MRRLLALSVLFAVGCSGSTTPTAPTPAPVVVVAPPVAIAPPVVAAPNPLLSDPRFNLAFYRMFALNGFESPNALQPLRRQTQAPRIYLRTIHDITGASIDAVTLDQTAAALINTAGSLTGVFGLAGLEQGTGTGPAGWITVAWTDDPQRKSCGSSVIGGTRISLYTNTPGCQCQGGPLVLLHTVKHELGHALGFYHTDGRNDLMFGDWAVCDRNPSDREVFAARVAYSQPVGSFDPK